MRTLTICFWPFIFTVTIPPPADASTVTEFTCLCRSSCSCRIAKSICWRALTSIRIPLGSVLLRNLSSEALQHRPDHRIALKLCTQFLRAARCRRSRRCNCFQFSTDGATGRPSTFARYGTDPFKRISFLRASPQTAASPAQINSQFRAVEFPSGCSGPPVRPRIFAALESRL